MNQLPQSPPLIFKIVSLILVLLLSTVQPCLGSGLPRTDASHPACVRPVLLGTTTPPPLAFSMRSLFSGTHSRTRVIQFAIGTMAIALFIMLRK